MNQRKSSISHAKSYEEMGEFWDTHDLTDFWDLTEPVEIEVVIQSEDYYSEWIDNEAVHEP